jgi:hypothetical protein
MPTIVANLVVAVECRSGRHVPVANSRYDAVSVVRNSPKRTSANYHWHVAAAPACVHALYNEVRIHRLSKANPSLFS